MSDLPVVKTTAAAAAALLAGNQVNPTSAGGSNFIRFDSKRTGDWLFGAEGECVTGDEFGLDISSLKHGQIQWHNKKANKRMVAINQPLPMPQEPIHYTDAKGKPQVDEANEARAFQGTFEDGTTFEFETSTFGGRKAVDAMLAELFVRARQGSEYLFPRVKLDTNSYDHSQYGLVYEPVLTVTAWYNEDGEQEGAPQARISKAKAAPVVEEESDDAGEAEAPPARRRRRA